MQKVRSDLIQGVESGIFIGITVVHEANEAVEINPNGSQLLHPLFGCSQMRWPK